MKSIRALITTRNLDTAGMKYVIADLVNGFDRAKIFPSIVVNRKARNSLENQLARNVDRFLELPIIQGSRPYKNLWKRIRRLAREFRHKFDIVHSFDYSDNWFEGLAVRYAGLPWIIEKTNMNFWNRAWYLRSLLANRIICLSEAQRDSVFSRTPFLKKCTVIHTGIDLQRFSPKSDSNGLRSRLGISKDAFVFCCVAHLVPVKGHRELIEAFAKVAPGYDNNLLLLIGDGDSKYKEELRSLAHEKKLGSSVRFMGNRTDVPEILSCSDGFILPTRNWGRREAFGAAIVEAMACGLPVIATRSGGPEDIVVPRVTGWLVEAKGSEPLAQAIREMRADSDRREKYGRAGRKRTEEMFSREQMIRGYEKVYREVTKMQFDIHKLLN